MTSTTPVVYTPSNNAPFMVLPKHVDGYIDLLTLADIHQVLSESGQQDDQMLGDWIKKRYLYEPISVSETGREINTSEGFSQLDRAYRRVRSLTNKAQDKWPFFDRNWKEMPSSTVRNNARGEAAPGVRFPSMTGAPRDSPVTNGHVAHKDQASPAPSSFVPFGTKQPIRYQHKSHPRQQSFSLPIPNTPIPLPPTKQVQPETRSSSEKPPVTQELPASGKQVQRELNSAEDLPKYAAQDFFSRSEGATSARSESAQEIQSEGVKVPSEEPGNFVTSHDDIPNTPQSGELTQSALEDAARDTGSGKVRGPNGRYLPKNEPTPGSGKARRTNRGGRPKGTRNSRASEQSATTSEPAEAVTPAPVDADEDNMEDVQSGPAAAQQAEPEAQNGSDGSDVPAADDIAPAPALTTADDLDESSARSLSEPTSDHLAGGMDANDTAQSMPAYLTLAAEAEAVRSNLDKLPPNSLRKNKRKSEAAIQQEPPRKRGRPRKVEVEKGADNTEEGAADGTNSAEKAAVEEEAPRMATRRTTRRSTAANLDPPVPEKAETAKPTTKKQQKPVVDADETMVDVDDEDTTAGHDASAPAPAPTANRTTPRSTRTKVQPVPETSSQPTIATPENASQASSVDLLALGLRKTSSAPKHAEPKQPATPQLPKEVEHQRNGTGKPASVSVTESQQSSSKIATPAITTPPHLVNGTAPASSNEPVTVHSPGRIEYLARVHTPAGIVDVPLPTENLVEEAELAQKYADWMRKKGGAHVDFEVFKSIYAMSKIG